MIRGILATALVVLAAGTASGQAMQHEMKHSAKHEMKAPCPMHLASLALTPAQDSAIKAIHAEQMKSMHPMQQGGKADSAHHAGMAAGGHEAMHAEHMKGMEAAMEKMHAAVRAQLTDTQRATFDAALAAHKAEMKEKGMSCAECCREHAAQMKHED